jgi:hypothetical protein
MTAVTIFTIPMTASLAVIPCSQLVRVYMAAVTRQIGTNHGPLHPTSIYHKDLVALHLVIGWLRDHPRPVACMVSYHYWSPLGHLWEQRTKKSDSIFYDLDR